MLCATILVSAGLLAQDNPYGEMSAEEQAMEQAFREYATPGAEHAQLAKRVGEWTIQGKMWQAPGAPSTDFVATSHLKTILGGRFMIEKVSGDVMGQEFNGFGLFGFDNLTKTYVGSWVDNFSTGIMGMEGTPSGDGKTIHYTGQTPDLLNGRYMKTTAIDQAISDDKHVYTQYQAAPDGQQYKHMELIYTRAGKAEDDSHEGHSHKEKSPKKKW